MVELIFLSWQVVTLKLYAENTEVYSFAFAEVEPKPEIKVSKWNISLGDDLTLNFYIAADEQIADQASVKISVALDFCLIFSIMMGADK